MPLLKTDLKNQILFITLDDPASHNAFSPAMAEEFHRARAQDHKALVVQHQGPYFCSGGNLKHYQKLEKPSDGLKQNIRIAEILEDLYRSRVPTLAIVSGVCLGGGVEVLSAFHRVLATPDSLFGLWQRRIGLTFGWGGEKRLQVKMGEAATRSWLHSAATVTAWRAQNQGLVDGVHLRSQIATQAQLEIENLLRWGEGSFSEIQNDPESAFQNLWMTGRHKEILKKF